jgi:hypothetical protein
VSQTKASKSQLTQLHPISTWLKRLHSPLRTTLVFFVSLGNREGEIFEKQNKQLLLASLMELKKWGKNMP